MPTYPKDDSGNVRVDFVWGNVPMQPDELRDGMETTTAPNDEGDRSWTGIYKKDSDALNTHPTINLSVGDQSYDVYWKEPTTRSVDVPNIHTVATTGYSNFPAFLPNYAGDGDASLEVLMPKLIGLTYQAASAALTAIGVTPNVFNSYVGGTSANEGIVYDQEAPAGTVVNPGVSLGFYYYIRPTVPNVVGLTNSAAETALTEAGFVLGNSTPTTDGATSGNNGTVKTQSIASGTVADYGTVVDLGIYNYVAPAGHPIAGISVNPFPGHAAPGGGVVYMFLLGRTTKPTAGDTITIAGNTNPTLNQNWHVDLVEDNDSYNSGGTVCTITAIDQNVYNPNDNSGGTWVVA